MRQFIIVIEKYTKNDGNQNINGSTSIHEKSLSIQFYEVFCISILPLDHSKKNTAPKSWNMTSKNKDVKIQL